DHDVDITVVDKPLDELRLSGGAHGAAAAQDDGVSGVLDHALDDLDCLAERLALKASQGHVRQQLANAALADVERPQLAGQIGLFLHAYPQATTLLLVASRFT